MKRWSCLCACAVSALLMTCGNYPENPAAGDYYLAATLSGGPDSLSVFTKYTVSYQTGNDKFEGIYAYTVPAGFIDTACVNQSLRGSGSKTGTVWFLRTGACTFVLAGTTGDGRRFADSCGVTVLNPCSIAGPFSVFTRDTAKLTLTPRQNSDSLAPGTLLEWRVNGAAGAFTAPADSFGFAGADSGAYAVSVSFVDTARGHAAALDTVTVSVEPGRPKITGIAAVYAGIGLFVNDGVTFIISASDTNGAVDSSIIVLVNTVTGDSLAAAAGSGQNVTITMPLNSAGTYAVKARVMDDDSLWSSVYTDTAVLTVRAGMPLVDVSAPDTVFFRDTAAFRWTAADTNGYLTTIIFNWGDGSQSAVPLTGHENHHRDTIRHCYSVFGAQTATVMAVDDDGSISQDTFAVFVDSGRPRVTGVDAAYAGIGLYINDQVVFSVIASDTNGAIDSSVVVLVNTVTGDSLAAAAGKGAGAGLTMPSNAAGTYAVKARVMDNDSLWSDVFTDTALLTVGLGMPQVIAFSPDTVYRDTATFRWGVLDTNGYITTVVFNWGDGSTGAVSLTGHQMYRNDTIRHYYTADGTYSVTVTVIDDDGFSSIRNSTVTRMQAPPKVTALRDTFILLHANTATTLQKLHFEAKADTSRGPVLRYVWQFNLDSTAVDTVWTGSGVFNIVQSSAFWLTHNMHCDTVYEAAVIAVYKDSAVAIDTFYFWTDRSLVFIPPEMATFCNIGYEGDTTRFEYLTADSLDSLYVDIFRKSIYIALENTTAPQQFEIKIQFIVDSAEGGTTVIYSDTAYTRDFELMQSFMQWLPSGDAHDSRKHWHWAWRPPLDLLQPYRRPLRSHFRVTIRSRSGLQASSNGARLTTVY